MNLIHSASSSIFNVFTTFIKDKLFDIPCCLFSREIYFGKRCPRHCDIESKNNNQINKLKSVEKKNQSSTKVTSWMRRVFWISWHPLKPWICPTALRKLTQRFCQRSSKTLTTSLYCSVSIFQRFYTKNFEKSTQKFIRALKFVKLKPRKRFTYN